MAIVSSTPVKPDFFRRLTVGGMVRNKDHSGLADIDSSCVYDVYDVLLHWLLNFIRLLIIL
jgi:hypothetical protein